VRKDKGALWGKGVTFMRSSNEYGGVDDKIGSSNPCRVQRM